MNMKSSTSLFVFIFSFVFLIVPSAAYAAIPFFGPIIPDAYNVCPASWGLLVTVVNNVISLVITLSIVFVAPIVIAYAGFLYVINPMKPEGRSEANKLLKQVVVGIVVMLAAWLIVDAVMAVLYHPTDSSGNSVWGTWSSLITSGGIAPCLIQAGSQPTDTLNQTEFSGITAVTATGNEQTIRQRFANAGVSINKGACPASAGSACGGTPPSCTNVSGMQEATVSQIIALASLAGPFTLTGGTEPGHACGTYSHGSGYKVDLSPTSKLDVYLKSLRSVGTRTGDGAGPAWTDSCGNNQYVRESDHWDITIRTVCIPLK
jgi:hypothetical protein